MFLMRSQFALVLAVAGVLWIPEPSGAQDSQLQRHVTAATASDSSAALAEVPRGEVVVIYEKAALTIAAQSAPVIDVLREVCKQLGAELDAPSEANEPVVGIFGPGPARDVIASLLERSQYELGTAGSVENAQALVRIVVFARSKDSDRQKAKNPVAAKATSEPVTQPQPDSTRSGEKASAQEMLELLSEARTNFVDNEADPEDPSTGIVKGQAGDIFKALEAIIKTAAAAEGNSTAPSTTLPQTGGASVRRTPMQRRR
jgi:hypothetical protein